MRPSVLPLLAVVSMTGCVHHGGTSVSETAASSPAPVGWLTIGTSSCYRPPDLSTLPPDERRSARGDTLYEVTRRWRGNVDPGFRLPDELVDAMETLLLQEPQHIQRVANEDFDLCRQWAAGTLSDTDYANALNALLDDLRQGLCSHESYELVTQYLEVDRRWQFDLTLCKGERVQIKASRGYYTIDYQGDDEKTTWITAEGDRSRPTAGTSYPCAEEGCYAGQLLARFVDRSGTETVFPVNFEAYFEAPADGSLSFAVNDTDLYDNRFRVVDGVKDFLLVEIRPAAREQ